MNILFEAFRVNCEHGKSNIYDYGLHAGCGVKLHSYTIAASISCRQLLPSDSCKVAFLS